MMKDEFRYNVLKIRKEISLNGFGFKINIDRVEQILFLLLKNVKWRAFLLKINSI